MTKVTNNMGYEVTLTESQKKLLDSINSGEEVYLKPSGNDGAYLVDNGLCVWVMTSGRLLPLAG